MFNRHNAVTESTLETLPVFASTLDTYNFCAQHNAAISVNPLDGIVNHKQQLPDPEQLATTLRKEFGYILRRSISTVLYDYKHEYDKYTPYQANANTALLALHEQAESLRLMCEINKQQILLTYKLVPPCLLAAQLTVQKIHTSNSLNKLLKTYSAAYVTFITNNHTPSTVIIEREELLKAQTELTKYINNTMEVAA